MEDRNKKSKERKVKGEEEANSVKMKTGRVSEEKEVANEKGKQEQ